MSAYFLLFASGFIAATLFPASSEALLLTFQAKGYAPSGLFIAATSGNTLGACVNWYLGQRLVKFQHKRWFPVSSAALEKAQVQFQKFGVWSLLFSWLPVLGDPLTLVAGVLKVRFTLFLLLVASGKALRYALLLWFGVAVFAE
ncbi:YqaA family protein [Rheinheimera aquimaris]|uniref:YqaA family protein n=1 Tax=Rheinheimera aquimaris TaxID=412437 RepID=UPI001E442423|nr:YqaA family protein [Rheinheimera aquimaris]MCD1599863.1 DedA family protein [Rheinheimera aquimaris]